MASPISPNTGQPVNFHTNVNRAKTKRWVEAKSYAYDGDDWGDGDEYDDEDDDEHALQSASSHRRHAQPPMLSQNPNPNQIYPDQRYGNFPDRQPGQYANRGTSHPAPMLNRGQRSFDQGDDRSTYSTNIGGFEGPYPTAQPSPFPEVDHFPQSQHNDPRMGPQRGPPPVSSFQQGHRPSTDQEPFSRLPFMSDNRQGPYSDPRTGPYPGQISQRGRRSQSSGRPSHADIYGGRESPIRAIPSPLSAVSQGSRDGSPGKPLPPRKSSLSQQAGPPEFYQPQIPREHDGEHKQPLESPVEAKPLPFIRPADIYKRMAEEKEKERRASEDSARPNMDDLESQKRLKPALAPVKERRSEYGIEKQAEDIESTQDPSPPGDNTVTGAARRDGGEGQSSQVVSSLTNAPVYQAGPQVASDEMDNRRDPSADDEQDGGTGQGAEADDQHASGVSDLRHNPSAGFTSVVHQAFDDSQTKVPPTPSSTNGNSIVRSNSASASDISPIIERNSSDSRARPMSSSTITPTTSQNAPTQESEPLPPLIRPGFRRDSRTPSPGNSPARRPISVGTSDGPQEELGIVSAATPTQPIQMRDAPSPIPRAESPTKGTVQNLASRLENRSPASSSPVRESASLVEVPRPSTQRLESFRPSLPGGWNSYTTSTGAPSPAQGPTPLQSTDHLPQMSPAAIELAKEEIPTAGPPKQREAGYDTSGKAFEALAAAGSALSGAFHTVTGLPHDNSSENESSTEASSRDATPVRERPGGLSPVQEVLSVASSAAPSPPVKDTLHERKSSQLGYFPSPLRTSKSNETPTPMRPQMLPALSTDNSPQDTENDRLRKEIVRSLTPKSAKGGAHLRPDDSPEPVPKSTLPAASHSPTRIQGNLSTHPTQNDSYWDEAARKEGTNVRGDSELVQYTDERPSPNHTDAAHEQLAEKYGVNVGRPLLQKRFSWEASTESVGMLSKPEASAAMPTSQPQAFDTAQSSQTIRAPTESVAPALSSHSKSSDEQVPRQVQDRPTIIPVKESDKDLRSNLLPPPSPAPPSPAPPSPAPPPVTKSFDELRSSTESEPRGEPLTTHNSHANPAAQLPPPISASGYPREHSAQQSLPATTGRDRSFREILKLNTPQERIVAYNQTRQELATQDSGLANWLQTTVSQYPEHHGLLNRNGRPLPQQAAAIHAHKPSPSRSRFPRIGTSLGGGGQSPHAESPETPKTSFGSPSSSKLTSHQVQEEGKKLLQSAGKIGGKAGGAAKGLFAKGKNKFRASSGGGDKALLSNRQASQATLTPGDAQHSSGTATNARQISPQFPKVNNNNNNDTWSLSYAPSENISRTPTVDRATPTEKPITKQPSYANLGPPGYLEDATNSQDRLRSLSIPSPQVSALGSTNQDDIPSRSISEVTRPDERIHNASPAGSVLRHGVHGRTDTEASATGSASPATRDFERSRPHDSHTPDMATPLTDGHRLPPSMRHPRGELPLIASPSSSYSQPPTNAQLQARSSTTTSPKQDQGYVTDSLSASLSPRRSVVSAISSPSPGPPNSDHDGLPQTITQRSVSPAQHDIDIKKEASDISPPTHSSSYEDATPPYSATINTKEAEAAAERSLLASQARRQCLPAYQSPIVERAPALPFQPPSIVPVADLSARRCEEDRSPPSRPFSFVATNPDDVLHPHTISKESQHTLGGSSSLSKEVGLDANEGSERSGSQSYSRPSNDGKLGPHPALRESMKKPPPSQSRNFTPPQRPVHQSPSPGNQRKSEQQYRIPGPYGQQFKFTKPISTSADAGQPSMQRPPHSAPLADRERTSDPPSVTSIQHRRLDVPVMPRVSTTEYSLPGLGPVHSPEPSTLIPNSRTASATLLQPRSRSKSRLSNGDGSDLQEEHYQEAQHGGKRGGLLKPRSREEIENASNQLGNAKGSGVVSPGGLVFYHRPPEMQGQAMMQNGMKKKKKKGGFLRLSGLFSKSGKDSPPLAREQPVQRTVTLQSMPGPPPRTLVLANSTPYGEQQSLFRAQDQARYHQDQRTNSFQGRGPPVGGYYAPANQAPDDVEHQPRRASHDPESFIGGRRLSDQRAVEQARQLENIASLRNQNQAERALQLPRPQYSTIPQPHSAPPSAQHFDRSQIQQPRAVSQRFPPELRIDTSGRVNNYRRSQPLPVMGAMSFQDPASRGRGAPANNLINSIPTHSQSNPQRHSPYTDRTSQHSPYGYGSARGLRKDNLSHAIDLHKRSRSPRNGRRESYDSQEERIKAQDPANKLGTFSESHRSRPPGGESGADDGQEKPWKIDLPVAGGDPRGRAVGQGVMGIGAGSGGQRVPLTSAAGRNSKVIPPVELPGSKAPGDTESDEEIVMCSTAYPGQEWTPDIYGHGHWEE